tara:strand:- start:5736 stop:5936 length:201 start_codon:yes stop_codon:yes gene_type:complete
MIYKPPMDHKWSFTPENSVCKHSFTMEVNGESNLDEVLDSFKTYLLACGFHINPGAIVTILEVEDQ